jgi:hypothetical protein
MRKDIYEDILPLTYRHINGRWYVHKRNAEAWFRLAKSLNSYTCFLIASILSALEVWDIIGSKE